MARYRLSLQTLYSRRRKVADWLDQGNGSWWLRPVSLLRLRRILRAVKAPIKPPQNRKPLHRFPSWLIQQGAYWISNVHARRRVAVELHDRDWRGPRKLRRSAAWSSAVAPPLGAPIANSLLRRLALRRSRQGDWEKNARKAALHRFPSWLVQQGAYWLSNALARRKAANLRKRIWQGNARKPRLHRFPAWLVQQGASWVSNVLARRAASRRQRQAAWARPRPRARIKSASWLSVTVPLGTPIANGFLKKLAIRRERRANWSKNARKPALHRFPAWLVQQGAYWLSTARARRRAATLHDRAWRGPRRFHKVAGILALPPPAGPTIWFPSRTLTKRQHEHIRAVQRLLRPRSRFRYHLLALIPGPPPPPPPPNVPIPVFAGAGSGKGQGAMGNIPTTVGVPGGAPTGLLGVTMYLTQLVTGLNNWAVRVASSINSMNAGNLSFGTLPTSDPHNAGQIWNDAGTLKVSLG